MNIHGKNILIFGGTGSLGYALTKQFIADENKVFIVSRDENKQWKMKLDFQRPLTLSFIIGNVADAAAVTRAIRRAQPHIIISAAAMKHIDICEYNIQESINTNIIGTRNILDAIDHCVPPNLETVLLVSSDKACSPVNNYGMCKAISETMFVERAHYDARYKYVVVRYGNVLNSRGSIIPLLHRIGTDDNIPSFKLTDDRMTRFIMTLEQSVALIQYAITHGAAGEIIVPELQAMRIADLVELFSELYNKPVTTTSIRPGEKIHEALINSSQAMRTITKNNYLHIQSQLGGSTKGNIAVMDYTSDLTTTSKETLRYYLAKLQLLSRARS